MRHETAAVLLSCISHSLHTFICDTLLLYHLSPMATGDLYVELP